MRVVITEDDILIRDWEPEQQEYVEIPISPHDLVTGYIWKEVDLRGDVTLKRLFDIVAEEPDTWELIVQEHVKPLIEEIDIPTKQCDDLDRLEVYWVAQSNSYNTEYREAHVYAGFHGIGFATEEDVKYTGLEVGESISYSLVLTPVNEIAHLPVRLNTEFQILVDRRVQKTEEELVRAREEQVWKDLEVDPPEHRFDGFDTIDCGKRDFTVLDLFKTIFYEFTWFGTPDMREAERAELEQMSEEIRNGTAELFDLGDLGRHEDGDDDV